MAACCRPVGSTVCYWPDPPCEDPVGQADDEPWVLIDSRHAQKVVGGVTITGEILSPGGTFCVDPLGCATSGSYATGLGVEQPNAGPVRMRYSVSVVQPFVVMNVEDMDHGAGTGEERVLVAGFTGAVHPNREADSVVSYAAPNGGVQSSSIEYVTGNAVGDYYRTVQTGEAAARLTWFNTPWGDGTNGAPPVDVAYQNVAGAPRSSYFDFGAPIFDTPCSNRPRHARALLCCDCDPSEVASIVNGSFEVPTIPNGFQQVPEGNVDGWDSEGTAQIEIWRNFNPNGNPQILPYPSPQVAEILGPPGTTAMSQVITTPTEETVMTWGYSHARRYGGGNGTETAVLQLGDATAPPAGLQVVDTHALGPGENAWTPRSGQWTKPAGITQVRLRFTGTNSLAGSGQAGNLIDQVVLTGESCLTYLDTVTGEELTPAQVATIAPCQPTEQP